MRGGRLALLLSAIASAGHADMLIATGETGEEIARFDMAEGGEWCVLWNHSVQGFPVTDCY